jgi:hypothetical protein
MRNALPSEVAAVVANIDPDAYPAGTYVSDWVDMSKFGDIMAIVQAGDLGALATIDAKLEQATSNAGAGAKNITGKLITQLTKAGVDDNKQVVINLNDSQLDVNNGFVFARLSITVAVATSDAGGIVLGFNPRNAPASDYDIATVDEIVA